MLYNDFRPKTFGDMIGQTHISEILRNQVKRNEVAHAYLFCGTRGTGKTTSAKILAKTINCLNSKDGEPCNECEMCKKIDKGLCTDIIELDAASHNGVDDIRAIIDTLKYPAAEAKYRVYIIDECHMLSNGAVNAFLKTLEEPPKNVVFILATTDPQKLPITILSRCQKYDFRRIKPEDILARLKYVSKSSKINIDIKCLNLISKIADGAMRDGLSILEQVMSLDKGNGIQYSDVLDLVGSTTSNDLFTLAENIFSSNVIGALNVIDKIDSDGKDLTLLTKDFIKFLRNLLMTIVMKDKSTSIIAMADEDIEKLSELSKKVSSDKIINCIKILQDTEVKLKTTSQIRIALELSIITMIELEGVKKNTPSTEIQSNTIEDNNIINHEDSKEELYDIEKLKESKKRVIETLKNNRNTKYQVIGAALEKAKLLVSISKEFKIKPDNEENRKLLEEGLIWIRKGFAKYLEEPEDKVIIIIN